MDALSAGRRGRQVRGARPVPLVIRHLSLIVLPRDQKKGRPEGGRGLAAWRRYRLAFWRVTKARRKSVSVMMPTNRPFAMTGRPPTL